MRYELLGGQKTLVMNPGEYIPGMFSEYHQPLYGTFHRGFGMGTVTGRQVNYPPPSGGGLVRPESRTSPR